MALILVATGLEAATRGVVPLPPMEVGGASNGIVLAQAGDIERLNRIEETMRGLNGQIEELTHQLRLLREQMQRLQQETDFRFSEIGGGAPAAALPPPQPEPAGPPQDPDTIGTLAGEPPITSADLQIGAAPRSLGTLTLDAPPPGEQPLDLSSLAGGNQITDGLQPLPAAGAAGPQVAASAPTGDALFDYDQAYALIRSGRYDLAETAFRQFLTAYPGDEFAPEAQYWLGESLFARGDYAQAAEEFRAGYKAYPKSRRGADTLLKLGLSMAGLGYRDEACQMYAATLKQYPDMSNGLRQRVINEQASASC